MGLSCSYADWDSDPGSWMFYSPEDFTVFPGVGKSKRRARCSSCGELIALGAECLEFKRKRNPYTDMEWRICGEEIPMASLWFCAECGEKYLNLEAAGYCLSPTDDMRECMSEYHEITGFVPGQGGQEARA